MVRDDLHRLRRDWASAHPRIRAWAALRGWPLLLVVSLVSLGVAAQGSTRSTSADRVRRVPPSELRANILAGLDQLPRPARSVEQRFTLRAVPSVEVPLGPYQLQLSARLPEAGDGNVGVDLLDAHGEHQRLRVDVTRHVRALLAHAAVPLSPGTVLRASHVALDTTWVAQSHQWEGARQVAENPAGWTVRRELAQGALLCAGDLRRGREAR
jgi:hypothetical protein